MLTALFHVLIATAAAQLGSDGQYTASVDANGQQALVQGASAPEDAASSIEPQLMRRGTPSIVDDGTGRASTVLATVSSTGQVHNTVARTDPSVTRPSTGSDRSNRRYRSESMRKHPHATLSQRATRPSVAEESSQAATPEGDIESPAASPLSDGDILGHPSEDVVPGMNQSTVSSSCGNILLEPGGTCPSNCPFYDAAPNLSYFGVSMPLMEINGKVFQWNCGFQCVAAEDCGKHNSVFNNSVPDEEQGLCRHCRVGGCKSCIPGKDQCAECKDGWVLDGSNNQCVSIYTNYWSFVYYLFAIPILIVLFWMAELHVRPDTNPCGVREALDFRSRVRLLLPAHSQESMILAQGTDQKLYPLLTNLLKTMVAGPGTVLFFNYSVALIIWAFVITGGWYWTGTHIKPEIFEIGVIPASTPMALCHVIRWGHEHQLDAMRVKCAFILFAYLFTFLFSLFFAITQARCFSQLDDHTTVKDYSAYCVGLPNFPGSDNNSEQLVKDFLAQKTGQSIVGVSLCWDYSNKVDEVEKELRVLTEEQVKERPMPELRNSRPMPMNPSYMVGGQQVALEGGPTMFPWLLRKIDSAAGFEGIYAEPQLVDATPAPEGEEAAAAPEGEEAAAAPEGEEAAAAPAAEPPMDPAAEEATRREQLKVALTDMVCSGAGFIIFETERQRDDAVDIMTKKAAHPFSGGGYDGNARGGVILAVEDAEPEHIRWDHFKVQNHLKYKLPFKINEGPVGHMILQTIKMILVILAYAVLVYLPFAEYSLSFSYANGEEPDATVALMLTMIVVGGNQVMYAAADIFSKDVDFRFSDSREAANMFLYSLACVLAVIVDVGLMGYISYVQMVGQNAKTADGRVLGDLETFLEIFESYPMQKALGSMLWQYCFPATFLTPFVIEPLATIFMPKHFMKHLVRTHPEVRGRDAEVALDYFCPMDLTRYGDLVLNIMLAVCVFFFPGGYTMKMFIALTCSHVLIYYYDHWRVLRAVPKFSFSSQETDIIAQLMMIIPTATLLACFIYKLHYLMSEEPITNDIMSYMTFGFLFHFVVHYGLIRWLSDFGLMPHALAAEPYSETAAAIPGTFFSLNPIHCLRSKYNHAQDPSCDFYVLGKEFLLRPIPELGCYYDEKEANAGKKSAAVADGSAVPE